MIAAPDRTRFFREDPPDEQFQADGFTVLNLLDAAGTAECRRIYDRWAPQHQASFSTTIQSSDLGYRRAVHESLCECLAPSVARILAGYRITCAGFAVKQPSSSGGALSLHRDLSMVPEGVRPGISLWCPLVCVDDSNGCLQVVPGSHVRERGWRGPGTPPPRLAADEGSRAPELRPLYLRAGAAVLFDQCTCHASGVNTGSEARPVVTAVLTPSEAPLIYCHRAESASGVVLEVFAVPDDFYLGHLIGTRPVDCKLLRTISEPS